MVMLPPCKRAIVSSILTSGTTYVVIMEQKRNPRRFRTWDSNALHENLQLCIQYQTAIEEVIKQAAIDGDTPVLNSTVPTSLLYDIVSCYIAMYEKLLTEDLIQTNSAPVNKNHIH